MSANWWRPGDFFRAALLDAAVTMHVPSAATPEWLECMARAQQRALGRNGRGIEIARAAYDAVPQTDRRVRDATYALCSPRGTRNWDNAESGAQSLWQEVDGWRRAAADAAAEFTGDLAARITHRWESWQHGERNALAPVAYVGPRLLASYAMDPEPRPFARLAWVESWPVDAWAIGMDLIAEYGLASAARDLRGLIPAIA